MVFDKVRENTPKVSVAGRMTYTEMANMSMNQVLMRSINTSLTALMPVLSILFVGAWIMGAATLEEFGLALLVGLLAGAYSSIFIATPIVAWLKEREPQYRLVRERLGRRSASEGGTGAAGARPAGRRAGRRGLGRPPRRLRRRARTAHRRPPAPQPPSPPRDGRCRPRTPPATRPALARRAGGSRRLTWRPDAGRRGAEALHPRRPRLPRRPACIFRDITPLLLTAPPCSRRSITSATRSARSAPTKIAGIEARGLILGAAVAAAPRAGLRARSARAGKLPRATRSVAYDLEYGRDALEVHSDAARTGERIVIVDDVLATGGTAVAAAQLVRRRWVPRSPVWSSSSSWASWPGGIASGACPWRPCSPTEPNGRGPTAGPNEALGAYPGRTSENGRRQARLERERRVTLEGREALRLAASGAEWRIERIEWWRKASTGGERRAGAALASGRDGARPRGRTARRTVQGSPGQGGGRARDPGLRPRRLQARRPAAPLR